MWLLLCYDTCLYSEKNVRGNKLNKCNQLLLASTIVRANAPPS